MRLKPCPFCGTVPYIRETEGEPEWRINLIYCDNEECGCRMEFSSLECDSVVEKWNTRVVKEPEKRTYTKAQIKAMDIKEYAECIDDIRLALDEGRILNDEGAVLS